MGSVGNTIYVRTDANELLSVNTETGEACVLYEGNLLSDNNLINVYEDGIIVIAEATVYWSDLEKVDFKNIVNLQGYSQSWLGIDRIDNMIYFVVEYEDADQVQTGIASLDLSSKEVSLYHTFTGWKNRSLHVSDIMIGENGFYYVNAVHSKMAGGGLYYYDVQDDKYIRIAN